MAMRKISTGAIIAIALVGLVLTVTTTGLLTYTQSVYSTGTVDVTAVNVGVYSDAGCTLSLTSISWGTISPGNSVTQTIYVKNTGNTAITLSMATSNWNPTAANGPISVSWNRQSQVLSAGSSIAATLTLNVSSSTSGITTFSVSIVVTGTQA